MSTRVTEFSIEVPAKWVLTGEHSVLRGRQALAFPYSPFSLSLKYRNAPTLTITANPFQSQIKSLIGRSLEFLKLPESAFLNGEIDIQSQIPIGAGLGSSAALCVAIARLVIWKTQSSEAEWAKLATHLEDVFHGKSSGMDVNVIVQGKPIQFQVGAPLKVLDHLNFFPRFELFDSGKRGQTRECIEKVKHWQALEPHQVTRFDDQMQEATELAAKGLFLFQSDRNAGEVMIASAMNLAQNCFETWGLVTPELMEQKHELLKQGALAVKLTGSGLGGFWVGLWPKRMPLA